MNERSKRIEKVWFELIPIWCEPRSKLHQGQSYVGRFGPSKNHDMLSENMYGDHGLDVKITVVKHPMLVGKKIWKKETLVTQQGCKANYQSVLVDSVLPELSWGEQSLCDESAVNAY